MARKILCVAEKPAIAKSVAQHLAGGNITTVILDIEPGGRSGELIGIRGA